jgi:5-methylcytosine-specific restriction endonuclease McrA
MNFTLNINNNTSFSNELFETFLSKNPVIPTCQREYIEERVQDFYNKLLNNDNKYLGIIHCGIFDNNLYILDGQHRYLAYKRYYHDTNTKFTIPYITKICNSKDELKQYFRDLNNNFSLHEIILQDDDIDNAEVIKGHIKNKYPKHISKSSVPKYPNINLDQFANYIIQTYCTKKRNESQIITLIENLNNDMKTNLIYQNNNEHIEDANKKNGFYLAYLFQNKRKGIPKAVRDKLWDIENKDSLHGKCFTCNKELDYHTFHASHIISVKNGGSDNINNLKICCITCNLSMGTRNLYEFKELYMM